MKRRDALKGMGLSLGYAIATPSILSLLQSCKTEPLIWNPVFLTQKEGTVITNLVDLILPVTETSPGALDANIPEFLDLYAHKVYNDERKAKYKKGIQAIIKALNVLDADPSKLKIEDYDALLAKYLKSTKAQQKIYNEETDEDNQDVIIYKALVDLRGSTIWAYKTSQQIGENVLAYDPVPGEQEGCISLEDATGGKAWSL
ncbi:gluconate 2-dehydrogenase subunit 3 family protein [Flavobacteriaceae bacterium S0862]|nr:gluconate 2-dehydrogenase subunit 3 family protein [Flavobacteriaceae bacterium S0862]